MNQILSELRRFSTTELSDALDELGVRGVINGLNAQRVGQPAACGRALPVRLLSKHAAPEAYRFGGGVGKPLEQVLKTMQAEDFVVMDLGGTRTASAWGGLASTLAQRKGVSGTALWGCCRDVAEIRASGYPVWAVGACPRRSRNEFTFGAINEPIEIDGITVTRNDWIVADESGVLCIPSAVVEKVIELAGVIVEQEWQLLARIKDGSLTSWDAV